MAGRDTSMRREELDITGFGSGLDSGDSGACAFAIRELKEDMGKGLASLKEEVQLMVASQEKIIKELQSLGTTAQRLEEVSTDLIFCQDCKRNRNSVELPLDNFEEAVTGGNAVVPWVKLTCIITTASFGLQMPNRCALHLVASNVLEMFAGDARVLKGASGFSMLFYAAKAPARGAKRQTAVGRLYSLFMNETMVQALTNAREHHFEPPQSHVDASQQIGEKRKRCPAWLIPMHPIGVVRQTVLRVVADREGGRSAKSGPRSTPVCTRTGGTPTSSIVGGTTAGCTLVGSATGGRSNEATTTRRAPSMSSDGSNVRAGKRVRLTDGSAVVTRRHGAFGGGDTMPSQSPESVGTGSVCDTADDTIGEGIPELTDEEKRRVLDEEFRVGAISKLREVWNKELTRHRTAIRSFVHTRLMFLSEIISRDFLRKELVEQDGWEKAMERAVGSARESGYCYVFNDSDAERELTIPVNWENTRWDIKRAMFGNKRQVYQMAHGTRTGPGWNWNELERMKANFPCPKVLLKYKGKVVPDRGGSTRGRQSLRLEDLYYDWQETVHMHDVALEFLVDRFKIKDPLTMMGMSSASLRTIHILAIAFRSLIRKSLALEVTKIEEVALGNVEHRDLNPAKDIVTTKMERVGKGKKGVTVQENFDSKLTMKESEYRKCLEQEETDEFPEPFTSRSDCVGLESQKFGYVSRDMDRNWIDE